MASMRKGTTMTRTKLRPYHRRRPRPSQSSYHLVYLAQVYSQPSSGNQKSINIKIKRLDEKEKKNKPHHP